MNAVCEAGSRRLHASCASSVGLLASLPEMGYLNELISAQPWLDARKLITHEQLSMQAFICICGNG